MQRLAGSILCCLLLFSAHTVLAYEKEIKDISATMVKKIANAGKKNVAVLDFTDLEGNVTEIGRFIAEDISTNLEEGSNGFSVTDRITLKRILSKHKLKTSDLADPSSIKKLGKIAGVDALVTGSVEPFGDNVRVTVKIVATSNARVIGIAKTDIAKTKAINDLLARGGEAVPQTTVSESTAHEAAPVRAQQKVESNDVVVELMGCKAIDRIVSCSLTVTTKRDKTVNLCAHSWGGNETDMIDNSKNKYVATVIQFLDNKSQMCLEKRLMPDIPAKAILTFEGVPLNLRKIPLLSINGSQGAGPFQFRNVLLSREAETLQAHQKIEIDNFMFELKGCNANDRVVTCSFSVTNTGADRNFALIFQNTSLYDDQNIRHDPKSLRLLDVNSNNIYFGPSKRLMPDIPVEGSLTFDGISPQVKKIVLLEINSGLSGPFQFRNIPLSSDVETQAATPKAATPDTSPAKVQNKISSNGFDFQFLKCNRTPLKQVNCSLLVTNQGGEGRSLTFRNGADTVIFDDSGVSYNSIGIMTSNAMLDNTNRFKPGFPVAAVFTFGGIPHPVPEQVNKIGSLEITYDTDDARSDQLKFHDISILPPLNLKQ